MGQRDVTEAELAEDLLRLVTNRLFDPLDILFESDTATDELRRRARQEATIWAARLLGADRPDAVVMSARLLAVLYPDDTAFDPPAAWWSTPLGRAIAMKVGHPGAEHVTYAVAGAMLGITRQGVHDLVRRNKLTVHPEGGVSSASVSYRLQGIDGP